MPTPKSEYVDIIIEDEDLAAWMTINNTFTYKKSSGWNDRTDLWNGVLIQVGDYQKVPYGTSMALFKSVRFEQSNSTVHTIQRSEFEAKNHAIWVNVLAMQKGEVRRAPMAPEDLEKLLVTQPRPIRCYFTPLRGGVTFWQNRDHGYTLKAIEDVNGRLHNSFRFRLQREDAFSVEIYDIDCCSDKQKDPLVLEDIDAIRITETGGGDHGSQQNPPQQP